MESIHDYSHIIASFRARAPEFSHLTKTAPGKGEVHWHPISTAAVSIVTCYTIDDNPLVEESDLAHIPLLSSAPEQNQKLQLTIL